MCYHLDNCERGHQKQRKIYVSLQHMYKVRYSCLSVQGIWGMPRESGENCTDPEEDRYLGQVLPHTGKNQPHPLPPPKKNYTIMC